MGHRKPRVTVPRTRRRKTPNVCGDGLMSNPATFAGSGCRLACRNWCRRITVFCFSNQYHRLIFPAAKAAARYVFHHNRSTYPPRQLQPNGSNANEGTHGKAGGFVTSKVVASPELAFIVMIRLRFADAFRGVPNRGCQDIECGIVE